MVKPLPAISLSHNAHSGRRFKGLSHNDTMSIATYIDNLERRLAQRQWIDVNVQLPDPNINVLVCNANGWSGDERDPECAYYEDGWKSVAWWDFDQWAVPIVTHWMPLPSPPAKETQ